MRTKDEILKDGKRVDMLNLEVLLDIREILKELLKKTKKAS